MSCWSCYRLPKTLTFALLGALALASTAPFAQAAPPAPGPTPSLGFYPADLGFYPADLGFYPANLANTSPSVPPRYLDHISDGMEALLRTIRFAEGTWRGGAEAGYQVIYGGRLISEQIPGAEPFSRHPEFLVVSRNGLNSEAAGAYQFMGRTWRRVSGWLGIEDFSPLRQDQVAHWLVRHRLSDAEEANINRGLLTREALHQLAPEWASLPTHSGASYYGYGQSVKHWDQLKAFYDNQLELLRTQTAA